MLRKSLLIATTLLIAACGTSPTPSVAARTAALPAVAKIGAKPIVFAFGPYEALTSEERRLLEASAFPVDKGGPALAGKALYEGLMRQRPELLATFLNQAAVLATVEVGEGRKAISYLTRIEALATNHVYAEADPQMAHEVAMRASKRWQDRKAYLGPEDSSLLHGKYDTSYRENRAYTSAQLCFSRQDDLRKVDIDVDEECPLAGDKLALAKHLARAIQHEFFRKLPGKQRGEHTQPDDIFRRISRAPVKPDGRPDKIGRGIRPSYGLGPAAPAADPELEEQ